MLLKHEMFLVHAVLCWNSVYKLAAHNDNKVLKDASGNYVYYITEQILCNLAERLSLCTNIGITTQAFGSAIIEQDQESLEETFSTRILEVLRSNLG